MKQELVLAQNILNSIIAHARHIDSEYPMRASCAKLMVEKCSSELINLIEQLAEGK